MKKRLQCEIINNNGYYYPPVLTGRVHGSARADGESIRGRFPHPRRITIQKIRYEVGRNSEIIFSNRSNSLIKYDVAPNLYQFIGN